MTSSRTLQRKGLRITGQVQGVGFRPFVYRLAGELGLTGWVGNDPNGVTAEVQGAPADLAVFVRRLRDDGPPLARIADMDETDLPPATDETAFRIRPSAGGEMTDAQITSDTATCADCLREMADPNDPRHAYPFINCTNCGPRYSLVTAVPYDRANTTMTDFPMCDLCAGEYADPSCRRFHAQPIACPVCGPSVTLVDTQGRPVAKRDAAMAKTVEMLLAGKIVAIKGLGGFHLACLADDDHAVRRLRQRKRRDAKPFAVMVADVDQARRYAEISPEAEALLAGPRRPIVLLPATSDNGLSSAVVDELETVGLLLPYTPLHALLFARLAESVGPAGSRVSASGSADEMSNNRPLVMTSGNISDEPLVKDNDAAVAHLSPIADALLVHDRRIARRIDDSIAQVHIDGSLSVLRRARGYAPQPVRLPSADVDAPAVLAVGGELKGTVCLLADGRAVLSEHIGDLKDGRVYRHFIDTITHLEKLFDIAPAVLAADMHPQYLSGEYAARRSAGKLVGREAVPLVRVQHHHAHIAACLAENGRSEPAIGLVCDGTGYGEDGAIWGCEVLRVDGCDYERLGHLRYLSLPGGDAAAEDTWRPALAAMLDAFGDSQKLPRPLPGVLADLSDVQIAAVAEMIDKSVNSPESSSLGRWFDAVAGLCGIAAANRYEGEAPMKLEAVIEPGIIDSYAFTIEEGGTDRPFAIDLRPMVMSLTADLACDASPGYVAAKFHNTVARFLLAAAVKARRQTGLQLVALSGGCFANRYLTGELTKLLEEEGLTVFRHREIPTNDACVALGQAVIAAERIRAGRAT